MHNEMLRRLVGSKRVQRAALASGALGELARPYVAGEVAADAVQRAELMISRGMQVSFSYLCEVGAPEKTVPAYLELLELLAARGISAEFSVKPSQLGLKESLTQARNRLEDLTRAAEQADSHVTLGMEGADNYEQTVKLWRLVQQSQPSLGLTLPVDIRRVEYDIHRLLNLYPRLRLCVGSYKLPKGRGIVGEHQRSLALVRCLRLAIEGGAYTMLASHDPRIIAITQELGRRNPRSEFEFQMYHGVRSLEQRRLADIGYLSRVLLPYGPGWYDYLLNRVATRPLSAYKYLRGIFDKR